MKNFNELVKKINEASNSNCFKRAEEKEISYLMNLNISDEIIDFYKGNNPKETIEINGIRFLTISEIIDENTNYTPGYILNPHGYCVIASTIFGDVYCIYNKNNEYSICIASHDEIDEETEYFQDKVIFITNSFQDFLHRFIEGQLVSEYYDLK